MNDKRTGIGKRAAAIGFVGALVAGGIGVAGAQTGPELDGDSV